MYNIDTVLSKVLLQSKDLQLSGALVDMTSKGYLNRLQILQKLPDHLYCKYTSDVRMISECVKVMFEYLYTVSLVVAEIVCFNKFRFKWYHAIHEEGVLLQKLKG